MPTVTKTWAFASNAEGLVDGGVSGVVFAHVAGDGNPSGSVQFTQGTKATTEQEFARRATTGETWETWGVPAGSIVTAVQITAWQEKLVGNTKLTSHTISARVVDTTPAAVHEGSLLNAVALGTTIDGSWQAGAAGAQQAVLAGSQASNTDVRLELTYSVTTSGGGGGAAVDQRFDQIELTITYSLPPRQAQVSWAEVEVPDVPNRRGQISWAEAEIPTAPRQGQVSWAEVELPDAPRQGQLSWAEVEVGDAPRVAQLSWVEVEVPDTNNRRATISWAEMEMADAPRSGQLSWAELEIPDSPRIAQLSWAEMELQDAPRIAQISFAEVETPDAPPVFISYGLPFLFTDANWEAGVDFYLEVYFRATVGTIYARLWDETNGTAVTDSTVSVATGSFTRTRSLALTLVEGHVYRLQFGAVVTSDGEFLGGKLIAV